VEQRLVKVDRALLRISNLAIHLQTTKEREAFQVNKEDHLSPILAMEVKKALEGNNNNDDDGEEGSKDNEKGPKDGWTEFQEPALLQVLAEKLNVKVEDIADFELSLFDVQKAALGGAFSEFLYSARLDNLASCFMAVQALIQHCAEGKLEKATDIAMCVLYDHEEVGSSSAVGAASPIMAEAVRRISAALNGGSDDIELYESSVRKSFVLSSDQAHAIHPNYASKHEKAHQPKINQGMVIKRNSNQRYATTAITGFLIREIARRANLPPIQEFIVRQDCGCGSTIGPLISTATGIRAIDMGCPQLSMHSIRETMGVCDLTNGLQLFKAFFEHFRSVDEAVDQ
jgi:aspartyl aminopeptidase